MTPSEDRRDAHRLSAWKRRERNKAVGACINETRALTHGKATHGVLCAACREKHRGHA